MANKILEVELTEEQYTRYKAAFTSLQNLEDVTDGQLIAQLKREAAAITYAGESRAGTVVNWSF